MDDILEAIQANTRHDATDGEVDNITEAVREAIRQQMEDAIQNIDRDLVGIYGTVIFGIEAISPQQEKVLRDADHEKAGIFRLARMMGIEIFEPYEPNV